MATAKKLAADILDGKLTDPTNGATHFYSPQRMPIEGKPTTNRDATGGLETVPGITDDNGNPVRSYRPGWSVDPRFENIPTPGFPERAFKFYRQTDGAGRVH